MHNEVFSSVSLACLVLEWQVSAVRFLAGPSCEEQKSVMDGAGRGCGKQIASGPDLHTPEPEPIVPCCAAKKPAWGAREHFASMANRPSAVAFLSKPHAAAKSLLMFPAMMDLQPK